ncbi:MAG: thiolase family protein [Syntrophorhabdales bacterium]
MRDVCIIGGATTVFGKFPERTPEGLGGAAVLAAMKDAGIRPKDVQFASCGTVYSGFCTGQRVFKEVGITEIEILNVENACASGASSVRESWLRIATGQCDIAVAAGVESMTTSPVAGKLIPPPADDLDGQLGLSVPMFFAMLMKRHMHQHGTTMEQFARISVKNHHNGCLNPYSQFQQELTVEQILASRMICAPITLLQCCPNSDGAAAVVMCSKEIAARYTARPMHVAGSSLRSGDYLHRWGDATFSDMSHNAAFQAYEMAGCGPDDIDLIELHDAFAVSELMHYEDLGLCKKGEGGMLIDSGATSLDGKIPVNPSGGLLSKGHPLGATGVAQVVEAWHQLRGMAGSHQVKNARVALTHVLGGYVSGIESGAASVHIFKI